MVAFIVVAYDQTSPNPAIRQIWTEGQLLPYPSYDTRRRNLKLSEVQSHRLRHRVRQGLPGELNRRKYTKAQLGVSATQKHF